MNILIGCEKSGTVRDAFAAKGHNAWSCDVQASDLPGQHIQSDIRNVIHEAWDMAIFFPPCQYLAWSGERWMKEKPERLQYRLDAIQLFLNLYNAPIEKIIIENSMSKFLEKNFRRPNQYIHPYHFGEPYKKTTCLWLKNVPPLVPTNILPIGKRQPFAYLMPGGKQQSEKRAKTFPGIARAMADQWG